MTAPRSHEEEISRLQAKQSEAVMPLIGPLLDAWEGTPNDVKGYLKEHASSLHHWLSNIDGAMTGGGS